MHPSRAHRLAELLTLVLLALIVGACAPAPTPPAPASTPPPAGPPITVLPANGATAVNPLDPVSVTTSGGGTLEAVAMTNDEGRAIDGIFTPDHLSWSPGFPWATARPTPSP